MSAQFWLDACRSAINTPLEATTIPVTSGLGTTVVSVQPSMRIVVMPLEPNFHALPPSERRVRRLRCSEQLDVLAVEAPGCG